MPGFLAVIFLLNGIGCQSSETPGKLLSQPMPGAVAHREATLVFEAIDTRRASLTYWKQGETVHSVIRQEAPDPTLVGGQIYRFIITDLDPGTRYSYQLALDGQVVDLLWEKPTFRTLEDWRFRSPAPDFTFLTGSCNYINEAKYDRPGKPYGQGTGILDHMSNSGADFMLWLGDNLYLRPADDTSRSGIWQRYQTKMSSPELQRLRSAMHHYATWDDHDFGPNDASKSYIFADTAFAAFKAYWANPSYGTWQTPGVFTSFDWSDCAFFLLDNRTYRDANRLNQEQYPDKTQFGKAQKEWLKQQLLEKRNATFKFIALGGQVLRGNTFESMGNYPKDQQEILDFIRENELRGVVFISGDRHFTELTKVERPDTYPLYELTSSPLTSGIAGSIKSGKEKNPMRVEGTLVDTQNYCSITVTGPKQERKLVIKAVDKDNREWWTREITAAELR